MFTLEREKKIRIRRADTTKHTDPSGGRRQLINCIHFIYLQFVKNGSFVRTVR